MRGGNVLFVIGAPRSGTTWLQKILASHDSIASAQESDFFTSFAKPALDNYDLQLRYPSERGGTGLPAYFEEQEFNSLIRELFYKMISRVADYSDDKLFVEKTPSHALTIESIDRVLPEARFIHIVRNPSDVAASMMSASKTWGREWAPKNIFTASRMWKRHTMTARNSLYNIGKEKQVIIKYEDLKSNPVGTVTRLVSSFSLPIKHSEIEVMLVTANEYKLKVYGAFGGVYGGYEKEPKDFARKNTSESRRKRELFFVEKVLQKIYLRNEMRYYGY